MAVVVPKEWDHEADVIIAGGGAAGLPAAIVVAEVGLKATLVESMPACGGSISIGIGDFAIAGSDEQKAAGIDDSPDIFYQDLINTCGADPEIARAYVDNHLDAYNMLKEEGIKWPGLVPLPGHSRVRSLGWLLGYGPKIVKALENRAKKVGVEILFRHQAARLIADMQTGRVMGLKVNVKDEAKNFKARRAVILATGGFGRNRSNDNDIRFVVPISGYLYR
ncbi:Urocanate reductase [subsurface metagenome]